MNSDTSVTRKYPPNPMNMINRTVNPTSGSVKLTKIDSQSKDGLGRILPTFDISASDIATIGETPIKPGVPVQRVVATINKVQIGSTTFDMLTGGYLNTTLNTLNDGGGYAAVGAWEYVQNTSTGESVTDGGIAFGSRTRPEDLKRIVNGSYSGVATGKYLYQTDLINNRSVAYAGAVIKANVDVAKKIVTIEVPKMSRAPTSGNWTNDPNLAGPAYFTCTANIDPATNFFSCDLLSSDGYGSTGKITGRFYGPNGEEIAGVLNYTDRSFMYSDQVVAGVLLRKM